MPSALTTSMGMVGRLHNRVGKIDNVPFHVLEQGKGMQGEVMLLFALTILCPALLLSDRVIKANDLRRLINYFTTKEAEGSRLQF